MRVVSRYEVKGRGVAVVLEPSPKRKPMLGSVLRHADGRFWIIEGVEAHAVENPKPPYGLLVTLPMSDDAPALGEEVTLVERITLEDAWDAGYAACHQDMSNGMSFCPHEPTPNPYRGQPR